MALEYLPPKQCGIVACVNTAWKEVVDMPCLWKYHLLTTWPSLGPVIKALETNINNHEGDDDDEEEEEGDEPAKSLKKLFERIWSKRRSTPSLPDDVLRRHFEHVFISVQFTSPSHKEPLASKVFPLSDPDVVKALMVRQEEEEENRLALEVSPPIAPIDLGGCTMEVMMIDGAEGKALGHGTTKCHGIDDGFWDCYVPVDGGGRRVDGSLTMEARPRWEPSTIDEDMVPSTMAVDIYMRFQLGDECEKLDFFDSVREGWLTMAQVFMPWKKVKMA